MRAFTVYGRKCISRALTHALLQRFAAGSGPRGGLRRAWAPSSANHTASRFRFITGSAELAQSDPLHGPDPAGSKCMGGWGNHADGDVPPGTSGGGEFVGGLVGGSSK